MFARTSRLLLRPGWADDAPALSAALNDETVARNLGRVPFPYSIDDAQAFLALPIDHRHPRLLAFSRTQGTPRLIGGCGLKPCEDGAVELGYWVARPYWGLGFATEATSALVHAARAMGHRTIRACHAVDNPASSRVLRKLGFRPTGEFVRVHSTARGEDVLTVLFEDSGEADMRPDVVAELYGDAGVMAA
ncbi:GNAT family N-acetyltransferase [Sphingobium nicotianae]|uniref:GNAT family N-acetyltransferase n=1 Tax=Sphingobium nicotianae TaxID=2782607 RepID=A0A9X1DEK4_9SPHN|nr:GNAT family N-acetyltransferase [Sphingobium nicotianae]MBT2188762.1 GNAT family N-acetyltransferase [Sphingobium nicotianae]